MIGTHLPLCRKTVLEEQTKGCTYGNSCHINPCPTGLGKKVESHAMQGCKRRWYLEETSGEMKVESRLELLFLSLEKCVG
jgi:hypothetical protein